MVKAGELPIKVLMSSEMSASGRDFSALNLDLDGVHVLLLLYDHCSTLSLKRMAISRRGQS